MCNGVTFYSRDWRNIVNQLYFILKKKNPQLEHGSQQTSRNADLGISVYPSKFSHTPTGVLFPSPSPGELHEFFSFPLCHEPH